MEQIALLRPAPLRFSPRARVAILFQAEQGFPRRTQRDSYRFLFLAWPTCGFSFSLVSFSIKRRATCSFCRDLRSLGNGKVISSNTGDSLAGGGSKSDGASCNAEANL